MKKSIIFSVIAVLVVGVIFFVFQRHWSKNTVSVPSTQREVVRQDVAPNDTDRDGIPNDVEARLGTSETEYDTDGDGLSDIDELNYWQTDPLLADTDGDGFTDSWEILHGYNPSGEGNLQVP